MPVGSICICMHVDMELMLPSHLLQTNELHFLMLLAHSTSVSQLPHFPSSMLLMYLALSLSVSFPAVDVLSAGCRSLSTTCSNGMSTGR